MVAAAPSVDDPVGFHRRCIAAFDQRVGAIADEQWQAPTPCADWRVSDLVEHLVDECRWTPALLAGHTIAEAEAEIETGLGPDPVETWSHAAAAASTAVVAADLDATCHLSFGDYPARFYITQVAVDHLVHAWDLARAIGADERLDSDLVAELDDWFDDDVAADYRAAGVIGDAGDVPVDADRQTRLLARFGRTP